nr:MAG TPA: hypothetical protein [Caudoviricetes sp.]
MPICYAETLKCGFGNIPQEAQAIFRWMIFLTTLTLHQQSRQKTMANTLWHPASKQPRERTQLLLLATKTTWRDKDGKLLQ